MWCTSPLVAFRYHAHDVSVHEHVLKTRLIYFYQAVAGSRSREDVGFANFHPKSPTKIVDLPWPAFCALVQWAYTDTLQPLFEHKNDADYWNRVALILGVDDLRKALTRKSRWVWVKEKCAHFRDLDWSSYGAKIARLFSLVVAFFLALPATVSLVLFFIGTVLWELIRISILFQFLAVTGVSLGLVTGLLTSESVLTNIRPLLTEVKSYVLPIAAYFVWQVQVDMCSILLKMRQIPNEGFADWCRERVQEDPVVANWIHEANSWKN